MSYLRPIGMACCGSDTQMPNPLLRQLTHRPFPEAAGALRAAAGAITVAWDAAVRAALPQMRHLTALELRDSTPDILLAIADALASDDPRMIRGLVAHAPNQGLSRLALRFDVAEVMQEDRLLRGILVEHVEDRLGRRLDGPESAALHAAVDVMLQRSVIALVEEQKKQLRAAAETELKFVSYLSHDLGNDLNGVGLSLDVLGEELQAAGGAGRFAGAADALAEARRNIDGTVAGMRRLLDHERLRATAAGPAGPAGAAVDVRAVAVRVAARCAAGAAAAGVTLAVEVTPGWVVWSDADLLAIVLQNLVGNGIKHGGGGPGGGTVRVGGGPGAAGAGGRVWVADDGAGIGPAAARDLFEAFARGRAARGRPGVGLGLAIAAQAARLLGAHLAVDPTPGGGATFRLDLPTAAAAGSDGGVPMAGPGGGGDGAPEA